MTRYELVERIGSGGMAEIFKAKAIAAGGFEKPVAIKRILPHLSQDKRFVELLIAEANILSFLRHRNIVQIFDVGLGPDGNYFLVMEYVDGIDLGRLQEGLRSHNKRLPLDLALYIMCEVCEALEQAHSARGPDGQPMRLVHRDVSPSNVLLSRSGEAKLTDFGIAKRPEEVTGHGTVRGKFAYISPEQALNAHVDARSDVFSVGILLHELILGKRLFSALPDFEALEAVRDARVPRLRQIDPAIPPELDEIVAKALARNPDDRFGSAAELGKELRGIRYSLPESSGDPAQELSGLVARFAEDGPRPQAPQEDLGEDKTVVRINSAAGFSLSNDYDESRHKSYADARQILDLFEEEITRSGEAEDIARMQASMGNADPDSMDATIEARRLSSQGEDDGEEATVVVDSPSFLATRASASAGNASAGNASDDRPTTTLRAAPEPKAAVHSDAGSAMDEPTFMASFDELATNRKPGDAGAPRPAEAPPNRGMPLEAPSAPAGEPMPAPAGGPAVDAPPGAAYGREMPPSAMPPGPPPGSPAAPMMMYPGPYQPMPGAAPRRRRWVVWGLGITATALLSFTIAAAWLDNGEASSPTPVDAGLPDAIPPDAAVPDAGVDARPAKTKKRIKKKRRRRRRKKRRRRNRQRTKKSSSKKSSDQRRSSTRRRNR